jgi:hypothetical protein
MIKSNFLKDVLYNERNQSEDNYIQHTRRDSDDWKINKILGQLLRPYLALEKELEGLDHLNKPMILSDSLKSSLNSYNPVKSLNEIAAMYRSVNAIDIISQNLSRCQNLPVETAKIIIKEDVRNCPLFKRINN